MLDRVVREAARRFGDAPAIVAAAGWPLSYRDLDRLSDEAAAGLARRGIGSGRVLALLLPSVPEYVIAYAAAAKLGAVTAGVNPRLAPAERDAAVALADPHLVLATEDLMPRRDQPVEVVRTEQRPNDLLAGLRNADDAPPPALDDDPGRPVAIVFTSGTTGTPKAALFASRQLQAVADIDVGGAWGGGGRTMSSTAFAHVGFTTKLPWYLMQGGTVHLLDRWRAPDALALVERAGITNLGGVPPQLALMLAEPDFDRYDVHTVSTIVLGGGPATPELLQEGAERFGAPVSLRYSSTESGGVGTGTAFGAPTDEAHHSVGRPRRGIVVTIRDEEDRRLPVDEIGRVCLSSPAVMSGYWRDTAATAVAFAPDGALRTSDLGWLDPVGCLHIAGRTDDLYIRGGYNVHPQQVESVLSSHPAVLQVAVVGRPDPVMGHVGVAYVVARHADRPPTLEELRAFAAPSLAGFKLPDELHVLDALPLTAMDKIDRAALKRGDGAQR